MRGLSFNSSGQGSHSEMTLPILDEVKWDMWFCWLEKVIPGRNLESRKALGWSMLGGGGPRMSVCRMEGGGSKERGEVAEGNILGRLEERWCSKNLDIFTPFPVSCFCFSSLLCFLFDLFFSFMCVFLPSFLSQEGFVQWEQQDHLEGVVTWDIYTPIKRGVGKSYKKWMNEQMNAWMKT